VRRLRPLPPLVAARRPRWLTALAGQRGQLP
jgi:hypothetical protein